MSDFEINIGKQVTDRAQQTLLRQKADGKCGGEETMDDVIKGDCEILKAAEALDPKFKGDVAKAEAFLKKTLGIGEKPAAAPVAGTDIVGNKDFVWVSGKAYGWGGALPTIVGNKMKVVYQGKEDGGVVHDYADNPSWNGPAIDVSKYSKLIIIVEKTEGRGVDGTRIEINDSIQVPLQAGQVEIDLEPYKKDDFNPLKEIKKINFVTPKGAPGSYIIRMVIQ
ncbi:MAG: hypothetical protein NT099_03140 [Candidatus Saganbacteria bacterium]|nr:hypothetical protein [Candidatus Saganbacteria bacterium]